MAEVVEIEDSEGSEVDSTEVSVSDSLKLPWESAEQWGLRKRFLEINWGRRAPKRLICLSQCFINIEFLGCTYNKKVMDEVNELSAGVADDYREKRKKIFQVTFVRGTEGFIDTSDVAKSRRDQERSLEHEAKRRKQEVDEDPELSIHKEHLVIVKAQASVVDNQEGAVEQLNYICNRARVQWLIDYQTKSESRHECSVTVDDVLITRMYFGGDKAEAKLDACQRVMEILQRRDSEVRRGNFGKAKFGYLSSRDKRYGWRFPDEFLYVTYETKLKAIRELLWHQRDHWKTAAYETLHKVCQQQNVKLHLESLKIRRWEQQMSVVINGVLVHKEHLSHEQSTDEKAAKQQVCETAIKILNKDYMRVYDDPHSGKVRVVTSEYPISKDQLEDIISSHKGEVEAESADQIKRESVEEGSPPETIEEERPAEDLYFLHEQKLRKVKENLIKIPATTSASHRLNAACVRVPTPLNFAFKKNEGRVTICGVFIAKATGNDEKSVKEQACNQAIVALCQKGQIGVRDIPPVGPSLVADGKPIELDVTDESVMFVEEVQGSRPPPAAPVKTFVQEEIKFKTLRMHLDSLSSQSNIGQRFDAAAGKAKIDYEPKFVDLNNGAKGPPSFLCNLTALDVVLGRGKDNSKKLAKQKATEDATVRLLKSYIKVVVGPDGPEIVSSNEPIDAAKAQALLEEQQNLGLAAAQPETAALVSRVKTLVVAPQKKKTAKAEFVEQKLLSDLILLKRAETIIDISNSRGILNSSASFSKMRVEYCETVTEGRTPNYSCSIRIEGEQVAEASGSSAKEAKDMASFLALTELQSTNYTILIMGLIDSNSSEIQLDQIVGDFTKMSAVSNCSIGSTLMKKMGWTGGGIGKSEQGIKEPITVKEVFMRQGLGLTSETGVTPRFKQAVRSILQEYVIGHSQDDLVFSSDFSKDQRAFVHRMAGQMRLKSISYGSGDHRQLTIQRHRSAGQLLQQIVAKGGETGKYKIIPPLRQPLGSRKS